MPNSSIEMKEIMTVEPDMLEHWETGHQTINIGNQSQLGLPAWFPHLKITTLDCTTVVLDCDVD